MMIIPKFLGKKYPAVLLSDNPFVYPKNGGLPSGKRLHNELENHHF